MTLTPGQKRALHNLKATGTLSAEQEQAVLDALLGHTSAGTTPHRLVEITGYLGGGLLLGGTTLLVGTSWEQLPLVGRLALLSSATVALVVAGLVISGGPAAVAKLTHWRRRVVSSLFSLSAVTASFAAATLAGNHEFLAGTMTCLVAAVAFQFVLPTPAGHLLLVVAGAATAGVWTSHLISDTPLAVGLALFAVGGLEVALALSRLLRPTPLGLALGTASALLGAQQPLGRPDTAWTAYALTAALAVSCFVLYLWTREIVLLIAGVVSTTIVVPEAVGDWTNGAVGGAVLLLLAGTILLAGAGAGLKLRHRSH